MTMATGDDLELGTTNSASHQTSLAANVSLKAGLLVTNSGNSNAANPATALRGDAVGGVGVSGRGGRIGVHGDSSGNGLGVKGTTTSGSGVSGDALGGIGVEGKSTGANPGVRGFGARGNGVEGETAANDRELAGVRGRSTQSHGVRGTSRDRAGVLGESTNSRGVHGRSRATDGVLGESERSTGVHGVGAWGVEGQGVVGVVGLSTAQNIGIGVVGVGPAIGVWAASKAGVAGRFDGDVFIDGDLTKTGALSAAVPFPDGSLRRLYAIESPESWFEDFGEARLVRGRATVKIDPGFAAVVRGGYQVFLTPYGDSSGLYVSRRSRRGFEVREQKGGTSTLAFGYRIVARRKDIADPRLPRVKRPGGPAEPPAVPSDRRGVR
jgi:hypothetical protein